VTTGPIHRVNRLDLTVKPWRWPFAEDQRSAIDAYFAAQRVATPALWNGRVLLGRNASFANDCFRADYFETDFASFLAWRDWGFPDKAVFNGFGMGALRGSDGAFVLGEMSDDTANPGRIYFPAGMSDPCDIKDEAFDLAGGILREVREETGLARSDYRADPYWYCVDHSPLIAIVQILDADLSGKELRAQIETNLAAERSPELRAIHLVWGRADFTQAMPAYVTDFIDYAVSAAI
jgi:8-oxo-dGTP pyrophosphatase MutT (NUDIX family)